MISTTDDLDPTATWEVASHGRRLAGYVADMFVLNILASAGLTGARLLGWLGPPPTEPPPQSYLLTLLLFILGLHVMYYFLFETLTGRTPGKMLCQTRVMRLDGEDPTAGTALLRTLVRFVPFEPVSFLGALNAGWHDRWTGTCVVRRVDGLPAPTPADDEDDPQ